MNMRLSASLLCIAMAGCTKTGGLGGVATPGATSGAAQTVSGPVTTRVNSFTVPHVFRFATAGDVNTLNPHLGQYADIGILSSLTMAWLIRWDVHNEPSPELATQVPTQHNGGVSKDGLTITYHLRRGVRWSDGAPFNADDVVFSTKVVQNPANNEVSRTGWDLISSVDEPDKYTVVYHLKKPYSSFLVTFFSTGGANPCILPQHLLGGLPNINNAPYNALPVGIGPFKYKRWDRASRVVMVANPLYWRGMPKLKEVDYVIVPSRDTLLAQLQAKQLDMWFLASGHYVPQLQQLSAYTLVRLPSYFFDHLDFNVSRPAVSDPAVREALRFGIDRATLRHKIRHDVGILQEEPASRAAPYWDPTIQLVPFDLAQANALLDRAGWTRGAGGIRAKNGVQLALTFVTTSGTPDTDQIIELIRSTWKQLGVSLTVKRFPPPLYFAPAQVGGIIYKSDWDIANFAWGLDPNGDFSVLYSCDQIPPKGQNDLHWCNRKAETAMMALYRHYDQADRNNDDRIVQEELVKDAPTIVLDGREDVYAVNRDLHNFAPNEVSPFDNFMNVDI